MLPPHQWPLFLPHSQSQGSSLTSNLHFFKTKNMSDKITNLDSNTFETTVSEGGETPILVDFWAPWCGPCKAITPILEELAEEMGDSVNLCKLNVDEANDIAGKYNIRAIPTLLLFKKGEVVEQIVGLASKADLKAKIEAAS